MAAETSCTTCAFRRGLFSGARRLRQRRCFRSRSELARRRPFTLSSIRWFCTRSRFATPSVLFSSTGTGSRWADGFGSYNLMSYPICRDLQQQKQFFDGVFCRAATTINLSTGGESRPTAAEVVSGNYFSVLGVNPALGRLLTIDDDQVPGASPVVVLSYDFWKNQLGRSPDIVGQKVLVNHYPMTVVGVAAADLFVASTWARFHRSGFQPVMSAQAIPGFNDMLDRRTVWMQILGRLRPDVSLVQARAGLQPWFSAMLKEDTRRAEFPKSHARGDAAVSGLDTGDHTSSPRPFYSAAQAGRNHSGSCSRRQRCCLAWLA